jgi:hypothetical protein
MHSNTGNDVWHHPSANDKIVSKKYIGEPMNRCEHCGTEEAKIHLNSLEANMKLCGNCYNILMSEELEVELAPLTDTFSLKDYQGTSRTFLVERRILPIGVFLEAIEENIEFGYKFAVHGELNCNQTELLNHLVEKTRRGINEQQVKSEVFPNGLKYHSIIKDQLTGHIEYDEHSDGTPLIIIDGKPFTWEEVGKMLMSFEGFQMKITMFDATDDVK